MDIRYITPDFAVSSQLSTADAALIAEAGFRKVINNRPDDEAEDQPDSLHIMTAVSKVGIGYLHVPISGGNYSDADVEEFNRALQDVSGPVLAFCRTGTRSTKLWALSQTGERSVDEIINLAKSAGYDLSDFLPLLEARAAIRLQGANT